MSESRSPASESVAKPARQEWLTLKQVAAILQLSDWSVRRYAKQGHLRYVKTPGERGSLRFKREWVDQFMDANTHEGPDEPSRPLNIREQKDVDGSFVQECPTLAKAMGYIK
ncbi:helix-turn-helix domain-containing protein [Roseiconus lacunae]|uniref:helix-turn-helix domain-containing protein n=1 Tax=Roseiconus lacunae TaxID=2605694 RepID=UPI001E321005|nr:helix-turn-helix domain-containing protein [Roseiconus lacunae]MCD0459140.1 helix-turn-helix domain-containing protein [Roseiconus lacunae]